MFFNTTNLRNFDWSLLIVATLLVLVGLSIIYSVTLSQTNPDYSLLQKQIVFSIIGLVLLLFFSFFDYRILGSIAWLFYLFSVLLLVLVLFFGVNLQGTRGWFNIFGLSLQPVEIAKLSLIIFLANFFSKNSSRFLSNKDILVSLALVLLPITLVMLQPDLGSALVLLCLWLVLVWFSGISRKHIIVFSFILILIAIFAWFSVLAPYQKERVLNFIDPARDPLGQGYNIRQSTIAIGSGGLLGRGLGLGPQSQLRFLPETEADFIFASLAEELGFVGSFIVIFLYAFLFFRFFKICKLTRDNFSMLLVLGIGFVFFMQVTINIGMALGLLPVTGLPLPFISSGGSFLIISLIFVGILQSVVLKNKGVA